MDENNQGQPPRPFQNAETAAPNAPNLGSEPVKRRGPGRPRKDGSANAPVSPVVQIPGNSATIKNKPGRKPKKPVITDEQKSALGAQLCGLHMIAAIATGIPELVLKPEEGDSLANAVIAVANEYGLALSGKTGAAIQLFGTAAMLYVPRFFQMQARIKGQVQQPVTAAENGTDNATVN